MTTTPNIRDTIAKLAATELEAVTPLLEFAPGLRSRAMWQAAVDGMGREGLRAVLGTVYDMAESEDYYPAFDWLTDLVGLGPFPARDELGAWIDHHPDPLDALRRLSGLKAED